MARGLIALLYLGFVGFGFVPQSAAEPPLKNDLQNWDVVTLTLPVTPGKKVLWYAEAQPRVGNLQDRGTRSDFSQLILRTAVGYRITPKVSLWQGYAWVPVFEPKNLNENRIFQQLLINSKLRRLELTNRTRLEERWIENTHGTSVRLRHLVKGLYPIRHSEKWYYAASNELFINLKGVDNGPKSGFDQNRLYVGIHRKLGKHMNAEAGYLNQYINAKDPLPNRMNHAIMFSLNYQPQ